jgi:predicted DNA-binding transcriptional regulator YafY
MLSGPDRKGEAMPRKRNPDTTYGQKLLTLFARLLFTGEWLNLTSLARELDCSKQTVLRLIDDITLSYDAPVESKLDRNRRYYRIRRRVPGEPAALLTPQEMDALLMCRAFTRHLLGTQAFADAERALAKTSQLLAAHGGGDGDGGPGADGDGDDDEALGGTRFEVFRPGSIDYTPHLEKLQTVSEAMRERVVCEAEYRKPGHQEVKRFRFKPLKVFSWRESIYVHGRYAKMPGDVFRAKSYDPMFALQRFLRVEKTDVRFKRPADYDFDRALNREFGLLRGGETFRVVAEFTGWAADYVAEREWSPGQVVEWVGDGTVRLEFNAVSELEVTGWVLSFGDECRVLGPGPVTELIRERLGSLSRVYGGSSGSSSGV